MKNFNQKFIGLLMIAFTLFISQSYAQLSLHVNTTTNSVYFSNSFPVSVSVYDFNLVSSTPWSVTTSSGIDFGTYGCNTKTFGDGSSAYMCGIHSGYWEPFASGLISLDGQPLYSGSGSAGGIGNNVIYIDYTSSDQSNGIAVEGNVYNISGAGQSTSVPSGNRHIAYMAPQTIEYIYAEAHTGGGNMTSIPVYINGQLLEQDCAGSWGGSSVNDACGVCDGDNSSCSGCTSSWASNYDQDATIDDESCELSGCTDQTAINYNQNATDDDGSCIAVILGCMDAAAVNYSANANTDNGMCQPYTLADVEEAEEAAYTAGFEDGFEDGHADGVIYGSPILIDAIIDLPEGWSMFGYTCINSVDATVGFADISDKIEIVKDEWGLSYLPSWEFNAMGNLKFSEGYQIKMNEEVDSFYFCQTHTLKIFGCIDETAFNYDSGANTDDGSCIAAVTGCMDEGAFNYNPEANTDDASCIEVVLGCTNDIAVNYNESANVDDGSCVGIVSGCTDSTMSNYNESANVDDGSCANTINECAQIVEEMPGLPLDFYSMMGIGEACDVVLEECWGGNSDACDFICEVSDEYYEFGSCGCSANLNCPDFAVVDYASGAGSYTYSQSEIYFIHGTGAGVSYDIIAPNAENITLIVQSGGGMIFNIYYEGSEPDVNLILETGSGTFNVFQQ